jgi:hypothetical protein
MDQLTSEVRPFHQLEVVKLIARAFFICLLVVPITLNLPRVIHLARATDWSHVEDCDADGKDDVTGLAVPWPGFDGTRGDTPAGPGTADWWIAQNAAASAARSASSGSGASASGSGSSGSDSSGTGSSSGSSSSKSSGSASSGSGSAKAKVTASTAAAPKTAAAAAQPVAGPTTAATAATVASGTVASAPASLVSTASAESSASANSSGTLAAATAGKNGPTAGSTSLWDALTVGFTTENKELYAGLGLLAALALAGGLALGVSTVRDIGSYARVRRSESQRTEEPATSTA